MRDTDDFPDEPNADKVIIARVGHAFWLLEGEQHFGAMLAGDGSYPKPVTCIAFQSQSHFIDALDAQGVSFHTLWGINPAIIRRLERDAELVEVTPPQAA